MLTAQLKALQALTSNYSPLSAESIRDLQSRTEVITTAANEIMVKEGQYSDRLYFIVEGAARAFYLKDGKDVTDWFAFENEFICAIVSYFMNVPSPHYIEATEPSVLLCLTRDSMLNLCERHHDIERLARISITKTTLQLQQRIAAIQFETADKRYENLLKINPAIVNRMPLRHIASYLGITPETLSRIRAAR